MNKKLCFITPTIKQGGLERIMTEIINHAYTFGNEVHVIVLMKTEYAYCINSGINIYNFNLKYYNFLSQLKKMIVLLKKIKPHATLSFGESFNLVSIIVCYFSNTAVFISDRGSPLRRKKILKRLLTYVLYPKANGIIAQTEYAKHIFETKAYNKNIISIPNPLRKMVKRNDFNEKKIIVSVGRLTHTKNQEELIRIFKNINMLAWKLFIVGDGPLYSHLINTIHELELENNVFLTGSTNDVESWLNNADIFAFTSLSEGFPNALSEAVAFPVATIAYNCYAGVNEIINNNVNGILIDMNDKEEFESNLKLLMNNPSIRENLTNIAIKNREKYSSEKICSKYIEFITS